MDWRKIRLGHETRLEVLCGKTNSFAHASLVTTDCKKCMVVIIYGYSVACVCGDDVWMNSTLSASFLIWCTMHSVAKNPVVC